MPVVDVPQEGGFADAEWDASDLTLEALAEARDLPEDLDEWSDDDLAWLDRHYKWVAERGSTVLEDRKLPVRRPGGPIVLGALRSILQTLGGARDGVDGIPDDEREQIEGDVEALLDAGNEAVQDEACDCDTGPCTCQVHAAHDHYSLQDADVERRGDWWVIPDSVVMTEGVHNGVLRPAETLRQHYQLLNGVPITLGHPPRTPPRDGGLVAAAAEVHGVARNPRWDEETASVRYDAHLAATPDVDGLEVSQETVDANQALVDGVRRGEPIENSPGSLIDLREEQGTFDGARYEAVADAMAYTHVAIVSKGACDWADGCGIARAQADDDPPSTQRESTGGGLLRGLLDKLRGNGETPMTDDEDDPAEGDEPEAQRDDDTPESPEDQVEAILDQVRETTQETIQDELEPVQARLDSVEERLDESNQAQIDQKREQLAALRDEDPEVYEDYSEAALARELKREARLRAKQDGPGLPATGTDGFLPRGASPDDGDDKPYAITPAGVTVTDYDEEVWN